MKFFVMSCFVLISAVSAQPLYKEHFEGGVPALDWQPFFADFDTMQVIADASAPDNDGYVGRVAGLPFGMAVAGDMSLTDYSITAYVYVTVDMTTGSGPYQGLTARTNLLTGEYYYYCAEFDLDKRLRLYYLQMTGGMPVIRQLAIWTENDIPGGVPSEDGWHLMKFKLIADSLWVYWDGQELPGCPIIDTDPTALVNGPFGVYAYIFSGECETKVDNIIVYEEPHGVSEKDEMRLSAEALRAWPNPFSSEVTFSGPWARAARPLRIIDCTGKTVAFLSPEMENGLTLYRWTGVDMNGNVLPNGTYFFSPDGRTGQTGKVILLK